MNVPDKAIRAVAERRAQRLHDELARRHSEEMWPYWVDIPEENREKSIQMHWGTAREELELAFPFLTQ